MHPHDLTGQVFGRLTAITRGENSKDGKAKWVCKCSCGKEVTILSASLLRGKSSSCGCLRKESSSVVGAGNSTRLIKHGMSKSTAHIRWRSMKDRCNNPNNKHYKDYGGRGIKVCKRWLVFEQFYADMGDCPSGMSIDRINNDGDYEPSNCRWATPKMQMNNTRKQKGNKK